ncbi:MAG: antitoxin family protein [Nitrospiraceae bacterium]|nr:antitoxin family protein [Nitrospiraceae bacterium]
MSKVIDAVYENGVFKPERKIRMKEHQKVRIQILPDDDWRERFDKALKSIRSKAAQFTQEEIEKDIEKAIKEVRAERRVRESRS